MKKYIFRLILVVFLLNGIRLAAEEGHPERILVISSFHLGHPWTQKICNTINRKYVDTQNSRVIDYLALNSIRDPKGNFKEKFEVYLPRIVRSDYAMIVTILDDASQLILKYYAEIPKNLPIVFCCSNPHGPGFRQKHPNITGLYRDLAMDDTIELGLSLYPETREFAIIITGADIESQFHDSFQKKYANFTRCKQTLLSSTKYNTNQVLQYVSTMPEDSLVLFAPWRDFAKDGYSSLEQIADKLAENAPHPYLIMTDVLFGHGALGGKINNGDITGASLVGIMERIFNGEKISGIPFRPCDSDYMIDMSLFHRERLDAKKIPPGTIRLNEKRSIFHQQPEIQMLVGGLALFSGMLLALILCMALRFRKKSRQQADVIFVEHTKAEQLAEEQKALLWSIDDALMVTDSNECVILVNSAAEKMTGYSAGEMVGKTFEEIYRLIYRSPSASSPLRQAMESGRVFSMPSALEFCSAAGTRFLAIVKTTPIRATHGEISGAVTLFHDVTEEYRNRDIQENAIRALESAAELANISYSQIEGDGHVPFRVENASTMRNWRCENGKPVPADQWVHPDDLENFRTAWVRIFRSRLAEGKLEYRSSRNGEIRYYVMLLHRLPGKNPSSYPVYSCVIQDVTESGRKSQELHESNALLKTIIDLLPAPLVLKDPHDDYRFVTVNKKFAAMVGLPKEAIIGKTDFDIFSRELATTFRKDDMRPIVSGEMLELHEQWAGRNGKMNFLHTLKTAFVTADGKKMSLSIAADVTEVEFAKRKTEASEQLLRTVIDSLPVGIVLKDPDNDYRFLICNRELSRDFGIAPGEIDGKNVRDGYFSHELSEHYQKLDEEVIASGKSSTIEEIIPRKDGREICYQSTKIPITLDGGKRYLLGCFVNITELKKLSEENADTVRRQKQLLLREQVYNECLQVISLEAEYAQTVLQCLEIIGTRCGVDRCGLYYKRSVKTELDRSIVWVRDKEIQNCGDVWNRHPLSDCVDIWTRINDRQCYRVDDIDAAPDLLQSLRAHARESVDQKSMLFCGVFDENGLYATLNMSMTREKKAFSETDEEILLNCAKLLSLLRTKVIQKNELNHAVMLRQTIADNLEIPIFLFNAEGRLLSVNNAACEKLKLDKERLWIEPCHLSVCRSSVTPHDCPLQKVIRTGRSAASSVVRNGMEFNIEAKPIYGEDGNIQYILESGLEMTAYNAAQRKLTEAMKEAEAGSQAKSNFISTMNHELRTPLNAVIGFSELLQEQDAVSPEEQKEYLQAINTAGKSLLMLVDDILDISKIDADQKVISPVLTDVPALIRELTISLKQQAKDKHLSFKLVLPSLLPELYIDAPRIRQIILNLTGNALKFTHVGGLSLSVFFEPFDEHSGCLKLEVADTGIGIQADFLPHIFDPFVQEEKVRSSRAYQGSGFGLAITQKLVSAMHGEISVKSCENVGSTFTVTLKNVEYAMPQGLLKSGDKSEVTNPRILIVDDLPVNLKILEAMLKRCGYQCISAESGAAALSALKKQEFDIVLTDIWMPDMNGISLADTIRANHKTKNHRIYAITADREWNGAGSEKLFDGIFHKPVKPEELRMILNGVIK